MRSVRTTFQILEAVADYQPIGLSELARKLELPKSTVQRSIATLADLGWLRQDAYASSRWVIGDQVRKLNGKIDDEGRISAAAAPSLARLRTETTETAHVAVVDGRTLRLVDTADSEQALRLVQPIGTRAPLYAGPGKAALAAMAPEEISAHLDPDLEPIASGTFTTVEALLAELEKIRKRGFAVSVNELTDGMTAVSAAIRTPASEHPIGTVSVNGPSFRIARDRYADYGSKVVAAAEEIGKRLQLDQ